MKKSFRVRSSDGRLLFRLDKIFGIGLLLMKEVGMRSEFSSPSGVSEIREYHFQIFIYMMRSDKRGTSRQTKFFRGAQIGQKSENFQRTFHVTMGTWLHVYNNLAPSSSYFALLALTRPTPPDRPGICHRIQLCKTTPKTLMVKMDI